MNKEKRQALIKMIVEEQHIETKAEIITYMEKYFGVHCTLTTVTKDLLALDICKQPCWNQKGYYRQIKTSLPETYRQRLQSYVKDNVLEINLKNAYIIVKTEPGFAKAVNFYIDQLALKEIIGTVSGNDVVFILTTSEDMAKYVHYLLFS